MLVSRTTVGHTSLPSFEGVPAAHAFAGRTFTTNGRRFQLWHQFGRRTMSTSALKSANTVIEQLRVAQRRKSYTALASRLRSHARSTVKSRMSCVDD